ncbi:MAG: outer membrane beta-barrel protein [Acidobacteriia bacterium]|nr:outer membrane beta-barrel protein [Terriglobia bacterium]MBV8904045.1 outer membrane beta-barrel protein [Terriglobia bacterium]MBV9742502.1 outer membrane beta-barrel protein [Terriglobia bacterium]
MRLRYVWPALAFLAVSSIPAARAQSSFDVNIGFGSAWDGSAKNGIDNANSVNAFGSCIPNSTDVNCESTPSLSGFFLGLGGDIMLTKRYGANAEVSFQPNRPNYGPLQYRQTFYDFNGIYAPVNQKRIEVKIEGGIGAARSSFALNQSGCVGVAVCTTQTVPVGNSSHFQVHAGLGVQLFLTDHLFIRPQFDYHYVTNFTQQFSSNSVPQAMVWLGYSFGER